MKIQPGATVADNTVIVDAATGFGSPYTYSDMTGQRLELAAGRDPGVHRQVLESCAGKETTWMDTSWEAATLAQSWIVFHGRTAASLADLENAPWTPLASATPAFDPGAASIEAELAGVGLNNSPGSANKCGSTDAVSPRVRNLSVIFSCPPDTRG